MAQVELSSEDPSYPIEEAFTSDRRTGWRAGEPGKQTICLIFEQPQKIKRIPLLFLEDQLARTQEFVLGWSLDKGISFHEIVRQQYNFTPLAVTLEFEDYTVDLSGVTALELRINPDISRSDVRASLAWLRLA